MIKALWFAVKVGAIIALAVWIAERPGTMRLEWVDLQNNDIAVSIHIGLFLLLALAFVLLSIFIYQTIKTFVDFPKSMARYNEVKTREKGYQALTRGLTAVAAGDKRAAGLQAKRARKLLKDDTGLPLLLEAQAARLDGREEDANQSFVALLEDKDASFLGVRGLLQVALDSDDDEGALSLAEKALALHPKQGWVLKIVYDLQIKLQQWHKAEKTLSRAEKCGVFDKDKAASDRLALYLAQAEKDLTDGYKADGVLMIKKALKLAPAFAPASIMLADMQRDEGHPRKAQNTISKVWKVEPHGALAAFWMGLLDEDKAQDKLVQLRWIEKLLKANEVSSVGQRLAGQAALEAGLWGEARGYFKRCEELSKDGGSVSLYKSWAELEEQSTHDEAAIKEWLNRAAGAPADKVWVCGESGNIYERWSAIDAPHGSFNTITWDVPYAHNGPVVLLNDKAEMSEALIEAPDSDAA